MRIVPGIKKQSSILKKNIRNNSKKNSLKNNLSIRFNNWVTVFSGKMVERKIEVMEKIY